MPSDTGSAMRDDAELPEFYVAIVGGRLYPDLFDVHVVLDLLTTEAEGCQRVVVVTGDAVGVDSEAAEYADKLGLRTLVFEADWKRWGKRAGFLRNQAIVDAADRVVALWDGESKGTKLTIDLALKNRKNLEVVFP